IDNPPVSINKVSNLPIPIVYTNSQGNVAIDFWINSIYASIKSKYVKTGESGEDLYIYENGTTYKTTYVRDFLGENQATVLYSNAIGGSN
ncbi:hypothetical protein, partial [Propionibacterium freudenreichii]|uniref:hypothetical protein n=1 Tax=Propionibacterium freudenreichii TaxID=1744 RepID=UPI0038548F07